MKKKKSTKKSKNSVNEFIPSFKNKEYVKNRPSRWKNLKQIINAEKYDCLPYTVPTYANIEAGPSVKPAKKYCDITGLVGKYTDPRTKLRYNNYKLYKQIKTMSKDVVSQYLQLRNVIIYRQL